MKFFVPDAKDPAQEMLWYNAIKEHLSEDGQIEFCDRKILSLDWNHDGKHHYAEVGKPTSFNGEKVVAILFQPSHRLYHVCTRNRGFERGGSIITGEDWQTSARDFDE